MKPIETQIRLLQVLLLVAATSLTLIGFLFSGQDMSAVLGTIDYGESYSVIISFSHVFYFLGFLCTYLSFEFYGFKSAIFTVLALSLMMAGGYYLFLLLNNMADTYRIPFYDKRVLGIFTFPYPDFVAGLLAFLAGQTLTFTLAAVIKKITRNYFMFIRYPIGALVGFGAYVTIDTYLRNAGIVPPGEFMPLLSLAIPSATEFLLFIVMSIIPLYLVRLFLGIFRGRRKSETLVSEPVATPLPPPIVTAPAIPPAAVVPAIPTETIASPPSRRVLLAKALIIVPTLFGLVAGLAFFGVIMAYHYNLVLDVPYFVVEAHNAPLRSAVLVALGVTVSLMLIRLSIFLLGQFISRRRNAALETQINKPESPEQEDTVSEKVDPAETQA